MDKHLQHHQSQHLEVHNFKPHGRKKDDEDPSVLALKDYDTLVKYDNPFAETTKPKRKAPTSINYSRAMASFDFPDLPRANHLVLECKKGINLEQMSLQETEDVLNIIIPPRNWVDNNGVTWTQTVSNVPATRSDVLKLAAMLDNRLKDGKARETGVDYFRRELYTQLFDELIRQCTIRCAEHGLLLFRVRNEILMTIQSYEALYTSATSYGIRKGMQASDEIEDTKKHTAESNTEVEELKIQAQQLREQLDEVERTHAECREALRVEREAEYEDRRAQQEVTKMQIWAILFPKDIAGVPTK